MIEKTGYRRRTYEEILNGKLAKARELFGEDINTDGNTVLGKYIRINAYDQFKVEEFAEALYYSIFPQTSSGQSLDRLAWVVGMERNIATPSRYKVRVTGAVGAVVEYGFLVGTETGLNFYNTDTAKIGTSGEVEIIVECAEPGVIGNIVAGDITKIINPTADIDSIKGISLVEVGEAEESDYDFIKRFELVREGKGSCTEASIISALANIPTVQGAYIVVNESATDTVNDLPPKSIACYVDGGSNYAQEIGEAIFDKKPVGIGTYGSESVLINYGGLSEYEVKFSYASDVDIYIDLEIITNDEFESGGNDQIKANLEAFIAALEIGKPLVTTMLYGQIYRVAGVASAALKVSTDGAAYSTNNISIKPHECCVLKQLKINGVEV